MRQHVSEPLLFKGEHHPLGWTGHAAYRPQSMDTGRVHLGCWASYCRAPGHAGICVGPCLQFSRRACAEGIARSYGGSVFNFGGTATLFHHGHTSSHANTQCRFQLCTPSPTLVLSFLLSLLAATLRVSRALTVVLIFVSLMISDLEHLFLGCWPLVHPLCRRVLCLF